MTARKYSIEALGSQIEKFLRPMLDNGGFRLNYEILNSEPAEDDFETPDVMVKFSGPDVDMLLENRAELLLALEQLVMEMLRMPSEDHSRLSFDANDYRLLRIEELRLSAVTAAEKVKRTGAPFRFNPADDGHGRNGLGPVASACWPIISHLFSHESNAFEALMVSFQSLITTACSTGIRRR